jgi:hypothetical protein
VAGATIQNARFANEAGLPPTVCRTPSSDVLVVAQSQRNCAIYGDGEAAIQRLRLFFSDEPIDIIFIAIEG